MIFVYVFLLRKLIHCHWEAGSGHCFVFLSFFIKETSHPFIIRSRFKRTIELSEGNLFLHHKQHLKLYLKRDSNLVKTIRRYNCTIGHQYTQFKRFLDNLCCNSILITILLSATDLMSSIHRECV